MKIINPIILLVLIPLDPTDTLIGLDQAITQSYLKERMQL